MAVFDKKYFYFLFFLQSHNALIMSEMVNLRLFALKKYIFLYHYKQRNSNIKALIYRETPSLKD